MEALVARTECGEWATGGEKRFTGYFLEGFMDLMVLLTGLTAAGTAFGWERRVLARV
jgi:hypothetical protein